MILSLLVSSCLAAPVPTRTPSGPCWEYRRLLVSEDAHLSPEQFRSEGYELARLGRDGWELVCVGQRGQSYGDAFAYFKRPCPSPTPRTIRIHKTFGAKP